MCRKCGVEKTLDSFGPAPTRRGHRTVCRECHNEKMRLYYQNNPRQYTKHKGYVQKNDKAYKKSYRRHGLTDGRFSEMLSLYDGMCWSCKDRQASAIDHDHSCCAGSFGCDRCVRGLLCVGCNTALGGVGDSVARLENLVDYLKNKN